MGKFSAFFYNFNPVFEFSEEWWENDVVQSTRSNSKKTLSHPTGIVWLFFYLHFCISCFNEDALWLLLLVLTRFLCIVKWFTWIATIFYFWCNFFHLSLAFSAQFHHELVKNAKLNEMCGMQLQHQLQKKVFKQCYDQHGTLLLLLLWSCSFYMFKIQLRPSYSRAHHQSTRLNKAPFPRLSLSLVIIILIIT